MNVEQLNLFEDCETTARLYMIIASRKVAVEVYKDWKESAHLILSERNNKQSLKEFPQCNFTVEQLQRHGYMIVTPGRHPDVVLPDYRLATPKESIIDDDFIMEIDLSY